MPQISISDVFHSVQSGDAIGGVIPFENSTNGSVLFTLDLFADHKGQYQDVTVCGETYVRVEHTLLGHAKPSQTPPSSAPASQGTSPAGSSSSGRATPTPSIPSPSRSRSRPLTSIAHIDKIYSHPQAWGQCETFLSSYLKGVERQDVSSTSRAAELVSYDRSGKTAAISSSVAAKVHGLDILARAVQDAEDNVTRFFVIRKGSQMGSGGVGAADNDAPTWLGHDKASGRSGAENQAGGPKSLVSFTVDHREPGALADALGVFKEHGLNLTSINTRPSRIAPWSYIFFVEFMGERELGRGREEADGPVEQALRDLDKVARDWRWLGSWTNGLHQ